VGDATLAESQRIERQVRQRLSNRHHFSPDDRQAIRVSNNLEEFAEVKQIFTWLDGFIWLVGLGTVAAGIVGVSNISLISVKERTREIGLRKALGAQPGAIIAQIVRESVALTAVSGYLGLLSGVMLIEGLRTWLPENDYIRDPDIALAPALVTALVLVLCGAVAGYIPARRAASVPPVVALRDA
jgi:putative ABC transport system permease protein